MSGDGYDDFVDFCLSDASVPSIRSCSAALACMKYSPRFCQASCGLLIPLRFIAADMPAFTPDAKLMVTFSIPSLSA
ncbi:hypothetical protein [Pseudomonas syringae]|uniref:hypothetical protein n=1 Tax=Pseudomonas syringae TaxID=317 RepID=UPI001F0F1701|nr:hypothetical protein [Pseudomonas syringae]MCH5568917.1 hypothetical protein [Pseudomonas syringae pv. syringae]